MELLNIFTVSNSILIHFYNNIIYYKQIICIIDAIMKLCVPINATSDTAKLIALGADEFYCGYLFQKKPYLNSVLSRHKGEKANFRSKEAIYETNKQITAAKKTLYITFNEHFFPKDIFPDIFTDIRGFLQNGINHFIISDINLLLLFKEKFPEAKLTASTGMHVMNSNTACFLKELGINRIILPRHLTLKEIIEMINTHPHLEFEIFLKNIACPNIDGFCSSLHGFIGNQNFHGLCHELKFENPKIASDRSLNDTACAACSLWDLLKLHNKTISLKIVGRSNCHNDIIEKDVLFFHILRDLNRSASQGRFREKAQALYKKIYKMNCPKNCYY